MKKLIATLLALTATLAVGVASAQSTSSSGSASCQGTMWDPLTLDTNNMYPITIFGERTGDYTDPPEMYEPPVCTCPGIFDIPSEGIGSTFWQPTNVVEIERTAGCMESLGGISFLGSGSTAGYSALNSEQVNNNGQLDSNTNRMQIHMYAEPVFKMLNLFSSMACLGSSTGFDNLWMTEVDAAWQSDQLSAIMAPEAALFANPIAQAACAVDAVAAGADFPIDALFWCQGGWGSVYPLSGNSQHGNSGFQMNNSLMGKFLARQARLGLEFATIGPVAECFSTPTPIWIKDQYRVNQIMPVARYGTPVYIGGSEFQQQPTEANYPTRESTVNLLWQGTECCSRLY
jgi:conjugal transfer pilus assembly protein TraU